MKKIELYCVKSADYAEIGAFLEQQKAGGLSKEQWQKKFGNLWDQNPFFKKDSHERGWILRDGDGAVCGFLGSIPVGYVRHGKDETGFAATTWFVCPSARKHSLALYGCFMKQKGVLLNTTPLVATEDLLHYLQFKSLTADWIKRDYFFPVRIGTFSRYLQGRFRLHPLLNGISIAGAFFAKVISYAAAMGKGKEASVVDVRDVNKPPEDTQQWWDAFKKDHPFTLERDLQGLQYFFFSGAFVKACKVLEFRCHGELLGFVSVRLVLKQGYSFLEVIDLALLQDDLAICMALADKLKELAYRWNPDIAFIKTGAFSDPMRDALNRSGFWSVAGRTRFYFFDYQDKLAADEFYGTPLDGDRVCF